MKFLTIAIVAAFAASASLTARASDAESILEGARLSATLVEMKDGIQGSLVQGRKKVPITIHLKGKNIQFDYYENNSWRKFHMRLADKKYDLFEIIGGKTKDFPREKLTQSIAGTDLTYEDLALRFFYWPDPKLEGTENVAGQECYRLLLNKPRNAIGRYDKVYVWVHKKFGAFMKIKGHDKSGGLVKEFQVEDVMKVGDDVWVLKKMQVASHDPRTNRRVSLTDVTFNKPPAGSLKGLR